MQGQPLQPFLEPGSELAGERAAFMELLQGMADSWSAGDGESYSRVFTEDCDYVAFDGSHIKGREQNGRHHQALFDTVLKGSRLIFEGQPRIRFIASNVAIMHAMGSVILPWQDRVTPKRRSIQTYVLVRGSEGAWRITAFHNTRYRPIRVPTGLTLQLVMTFMRLRTRFGRQTTDRGQTTA